MVSVRLTALSSPGPAGMLDEGRHLLAERTGVFLAEIDLVLVPPMRNCSVSVAGPPSRSSSRVTVIFCAMAGLAVLDLPPGKDTVNARDPAVVALGANNLA